MIGAMNYNRAYEGAVATRGLMRDARDAAVAQCMSSSAHYARDDITALRILLLNAYADFNTEHKPGAAATVTASIEYPLGTFTAFQFGGSGQGIIPDGDFLLSDYLTIAIPNGALFRVRLFWSCAAGVVHFGAFATNPGNLASIGEAVNMAASGLTDLTLGGTITNNYPARQTPPLAILAKTSNPAIAIHGDSIDIGSDDTYNGSSGDVGIVTRPIGANFAYTNFAGLGNAAYLFLSGDWSRRRAAMAFYSHAICGFGSNDMRNNGDETVLMPLLTQIYTQLLQNLTAFQRTITPRATSTDGFATTANQTTDATTHSRYAAFNAALRAGTFGPAGGMFDVADVVEYLRLGVWNAPGYVTSNGVHPSQAGNLAVQSAGAVDISRIHRP